LQGWPKPLASAALEPAQIVAERKNRLEPAGLLPATALVASGEQEQREASPTAAIIDSQSVKSAEKGGPASIRTATMRVRRSRARSGIFSSIN
jgi:hypothetical protein